jgi:hypothetical protein
MPKPGLSPWKRDKLNESENRILRIFKTKQSLENGEWRGEANQFQPSLGVELSYKLELWSLIGLITIFHESMAEFYMTTSRK